MASFKCGNWYTGVCLLMTSFPIFQNCEQVMTIICTSVFLFVTWDGWLAHLAKFFEVLRVARRLFGWQRTWHVSVHHSSVNSKEQCTYFICWFLWYFGLLVRKCLLPFLSLMQTILPSSPDFGLGHTVYSGPWTMSKCDELWLVV